METFRRSLRALGHPISLAAIGLLLVNDHVLKAATPSWLTGKLSDFAGLFFFPFLLIAIGSWPASALGGDRASAWLPRAAFAATALWFAAIKLWPPANATTAALAGWLAGGTVFIAPDVTDVVALVVLWPAWTVWSRIQRSASSAVPEVSDSGARPSYRGLFALLVAALATIATSPCVPGPAVQRVTFLNGRLYAAISAGYSREKTYRELDVDSLQPIAIAPEIVSAEMGKPVSYPLTVCDPNDKLICYRIGLPDQVEASDDGGQTWQTAWRIPEERRKFVERYAITTSCLDSAGLDWGPFDLTFVERPDGNELVVALGGQGLLVRTSEGRWEGRSVETAHPIPLSDPSPLVIGPEITVSVGIAMCVFLVLTAFAWAAILSGGRGAWKSLAWPICLMIGGIATTIISPFATPLLPATAVTNYFLWGLLIGPLVLLVGILLGWENLTRTASQPKYVGMARSAIRNTAGLVAALPVVIFYGWIAGLIPLYEAAMIGSIGAGAACLIIGIRAIYRAARRANQSA